jgi:hypothetical protein
MAKRNSKAAFTEAEATSRRARPARTPARTEEAEAEPRDDRDERDEREDEELEDAGFSVVSDARATQEPDPREVDNLTERIFRSVLSRYGWESHGGRIEHIGGPQSRDRHR